MSKEKRKWPRIPLRFNINFSTAVGEELFDGAGMTENVSQGGMFFKTKDWTPLKPGQKLTFHMAGVALRNQLPGYMRLSGYATILRLNRPSSNEPQEAAAGVAVRFEKPPRIHP